MNEQSAALLESTYDVIIVNDPQPAGIRHFAGPRGAKWIWRCHIDSSAPDEAVRKFLVPLIHEYDAFEILPESSTSRLSRLRGSLRKLGISVDGRSTH